MTITSKLITFWGAPVLILKLFSILVNFRWAPVLILFSILVNFGGAPVKKKHPVEPLIFKKKSWVNFFFLEKRANGGGLSERGLSKGHNFSVFFLSFGTFP